jgi:hypothetical protein
LYAIARTAGARRRRSSAKDLSARKFIAFEKNLASARRSTVLAGAWRPPEVAMEFDNIETNQAGDHDSVRREHPSKNKREPRDSKMGWLRLCRWT